MGEYALDANTRLLAAAMGRAVGEVDDKVTAAQQTADGLTVEVQDVRNNAKRLDIAFPALANFQAAEIPAEVQQVFIGTGSGIVGYRRQPGAMEADDIQHPDGSEWAKATVGEADILAAVTDVVEAGDFLPSGSGSFTPTITSATPGLSVTGGTFTGRYNRIGNLIFWTFSIVGATAVRGSGAGNVVFGGFPLAPAPNTFAAGNIRQIGGITTLGTGSTTPSVVSFLLGSSPLEGFIALAYANGSRRTLSVTDIGEGAGEFLPQVSGWYEVAG